MHSRMVAPSDSQDQAGTMQTNLYKYTVTIDNTYISWSSQPSTHTEAHRQLDIGNHH